MTAAEHAENVKKLRESQDEAQRVALANKLASPNSVGTSNFADIQINVGEKGYRTTSTREERAVLENEVIARFKRGDHQRFISDPKAEPNDPIDAAIRDFVLKRTSTKPGDSVATGFDHPYDDRMNLYISMKGVPANRKVDSLREDPAVTPEFEQATNRIGQIVHAEFQSRVAAKIQADNETFHDRIREVEKLTGVPIDQLDGWIWTDSVGKVSLKSTAIGYELSPEKAEAALKLMRKLGLRDLREDRHRSKFKGDTMRSTFDSVLSEARQAGGLINGTPDHRKSKSGGISSNAQAVIASSKYPTDWIEASNAAGPVSFKAVKHRAHYRDGDKGDGEITLDGDPSTAIHELGHRMEYTVPGLAQLERHFYDRRTAGESEVSLRKLLPGHGYGSDESARPDELFHPYAGKKYKVAYELMTMGMQALSWNDPGMGARKDIDSDHAGLIWGALVVLLPEGGQ